MKKKNQQREKYVTVSKLRQHVVNLTVVFLIFSSFFESFHFHFQYFASTENPPTTYIVRTTVNGNTHLNTSYRIELNIRVASEPLCRFFFKKLNCDHNEY